MRQMTSLCLVCGLLLLVLASCTPRICGVPEPQWRQLTDEQRLAAIQGYNERENVREQARLVDAQRRARDSERQAREAELRAIEARRRQELMQEQVDAIYRGEAGQIGDLIRVTLRGGRMSFGGQHREFRAVAFKLANGEFQRVEIIAFEPRTSPARAELVVGYQDGTLLVDAAEPYSDRAAHLVYDQTWKNGGNYMISTDGAMELRNVRVGVEIIPHLRTERKGRLH